MPVPPCRPSHTHGHQAQGFNSDEYLDTEGRHTKHMQLLYHAQDNEKAILDGCSDHLMVLLEKGVELLKLQLEPQLQESGSQGAAVEILMARQILDLLASSVPMVRSGWVCAASLIARSMFECALFHQLLMKKGEAAGFGYLVWTDLRELAFLDQLDPSMRAQDRLASALKSQGLPIHALDKAQIQERRHPIELRLQAAGFLEAHKSLKTVPSVPMMVRQFLPQQLV